MFRWLRTLFKPTPKKRRRRYGEPRWHVVTRVGKLPNCPCDGNVHFQVIDSETNKARAIDTFHDYEKAWARCDALNAHY